MKYKYINSIPKPLLDDFVNNRVVPIVGAGLSKNADIPKNISMPDWKELGRVAAEEISGYDYDGNAIDALSYYEELFTRPKLIELLIRELHHGEVQPGETIQAFCNLFSGTICTTNYDTLLEDAMIQSHRSASVIVTEDRLTVGGKNESKIIKIHGDFNHPDRMVITERDYDMFLELNPVMATYIANLFISNTMLLVGYSLDDNDLRGIWQVLHNRLGKMSRPAYCLTVGVSEEKRIRYQRRNIIIVNLPGSSKNYKTILRDFFVELKNYCTEAIPPESKNDKVNEQLLIPAENNRLCYISCASSRIARLTSFLYPILVHCGVTPVRLDDMIQPGDNWVLSAESLMQRSRAAIIDISEGNSNVMFELGSIISNSQLKYDSIIICEENKSIPYEIKGYRVLRYSLERDYSDSLNQLFLTELKDWCNKTFNFPSSLDIKESGMSTIFEDARRLFDKTEYSACILAAYSSLEVYARERLPFQYSTFSSYIRNTAMPIILEDQRYMNQFAQTDVYEFITIRNQIAHNHYKASKKEATKFMKLANAIATVFAETASKAAS